MILDTSFLIAVRTDPDARALAHQFEANAVPMRVPTVTVSELYVGVALSDASTVEVAALRDLLSNLPVIAPTARIARQAGMLVGEHRASDTKPSLSLADGIIAAIALEHGEPVVTGDVSDFESVDGVECETWG